MAELSAADKRAILGPNYKEPEVTAASRAEQKAATFASRRNVAIGVLVLAVIILIAVFYGSSNR
jgi:hypothetical protein